MGDAGDLWRDIKPGMIKESKQRRASNRERSAELLRANGVRFDSKNDGAHLIVTSPAGVVFDFWPGTGLWQQRGQKRQSRGVEGLLKALREAKQ